MSKDTLSDDIQLIYYEALYNKCTVYLESGDYRKVIKKLKELIKRLLDFVYI